jgi:TolA-binding protein
MQPPRFFAAQLPGAAVLFCLMLGIPAVWSGSAQAQIESREAIALQDQIAELRQELQMMQQAQQSGAPVSSYVAPPVPQQAEGAPPAPAAGTGDTVADLVVRVSALEEQNRELRGRLDDLTNQLQRQNDNLTKQIGDLAFKLGQGAGQPGQGDPPALVNGVPPEPGEQTAVPQPPPEPNAVAPRPVVPQVRRTPEMALRDGDAALARHDYATAAAMAREALTSKGPRAMDAQFLLARAEGGLHQYREAAADFYLAYNRAPKSATASVALLGVANSLIALNDHKDACEALDKLSAEFPRLSGVVKANVAASRRRASCPR